MLSQSPRPLRIIGSTEYVSIAGVKNVPAKIDTGADSSAIWASNINIRGDHVLTFTLFDESSQLYSGEVIEQKHYKVKVVRSSNGEKEIRYCVKLPLELSGRKISATFTLADRSKNNFPVLIGRRAIKNKFLVDVSKTAIERKPGVVSPKLNAELEKNPHAFHKTHFSNPNSEEK